MLPQSNLHICAVRDQYSETAQVALELCFSLQ